jgi:hypothetical protein
MDDYNLSAISQAKHEYSMNLVNILTPLLIEGIKSIFKEAWELCISNEEKGKYLMTFQNFLTRVPKWNQAIINGETERIISQSGCSYLEDLVTCVHISQLKILTSIRVANKQKKVDIEVPKLTDFIHNIYIKFARKLYSNVYLFELQIPSLQIQKNNRECEILCNECILNVVRDSMPIEKILRAYIDQTEEEEIINEKTIEKKIEPEIESGPESESTVSENKTEYRDINNSTITSTELEDKNKMETTSQQIIKKIDYNHTNPLGLDEIKNSDIIETKTNTFVPKIITESLSPIIRPDSIPKSPSKISFNDNDKLKVYNDKETVNVLSSTQEKNINAPKTEERLNEISDIRNKQRKEEEEDDYGDHDGGKLKIFGSTPDLKLDSLDIHVLDDKLDLQTKSLLSDVETLK